MKDKTAFASRMTAIGEYYGQDISVPVLRLWWAALEMYDDQQVSDALQAHVGDTERGQFMPKIADIKRQIEGPTPSKDAIIGAAIKPTTALAVLCRMEIGSWNLDNWNNYQLGPLAERCLANIPEWKQRIEQGKLTAHEKRCIENHGVAMTPQLAAPVKQIEEKA